MDQSTQKRLKFGLCIFSPYSSPRPLVFLRSMFHIEILTAPLRLSGASNAGGVGKTHCFVALCVNISKTARDSQKLLLMTNNRNFGLCAFDLLQGRWPWMTLNCYKSEFSRNRLLDTCHRQKSYVSFCSFAISNQLDCSMSFVIKYVNFLLKHAVNLGNYKTGTHTVARLPWWLQVQLNLSNFRTSFDDKAIYLVNVNSYRWSQTGND